MAWECIWIRDISASIQSLSIIFAEAQVLFVQTLCDLAAEEGQDVRLEVELSVESAEVQWMKQGILLQQNPRYSMEVQGPKRALTIHHIELADRGTYRCESLHDRTQARLSVERRSHFYPDLVFSHSCTL